MSEMDTKTMQRIMDTLYNAYRAADVFVRDYAEGITKEYMSDYVNNFSGLKGAVDEIWKDIYGHGVHGGVDPPIRVSEEPTEPGSGSCAGTDEF